MSTTSSLDSPVLQDYVQSGITVQDTGMHKREEKDIRLFSPLSFLHHGNVILDTVVIHYLFLLLYFLISFLLMC